MVVNTPAAITSAAKNEIPIPFTLPKATPPRVLFATCSLATWEQRCPRTERNFALMFLNSSKGGVGDSR